jgi:cytochrome c oxidase assembly protein subunit 15
MSSIATANTTQTSSGSSKPRSGRALALYAALVLSFMVLVILEGAVVRATGSGAGCGNHWPLCNGDFFPHHPRLATIIEYTHRSMTGVLTTLIAILIVWTLRASERGDRVRRAAAWSGVLLLTEALLGAVLVKGGYVEGNTSNARVFVQCIHFTNTMLLVAALALTWWWLRERTRPAIPRSPLPAESRSIAWLALGATIVVGATGSVAALADTLFPSPSLGAAFAQDFAVSAPMMVRMRWLHPAAALAALAFAVWLSLMLRTRAARWVLALIAVQIVLGAADVLLLAPIWMQVLHLLGADLYWIALVVACAALIAPPYPLQSHPPRPVPDRA